MIRMFNADSMEAMKAMPDKAYDLAIVDPPYGENIGTVVGGASRLGRRVKIGGEKLSCPKYIGGSMILESPTLNTSRNYKG